MMAEVQICDEVAQALGAGGVSVARHEAGHGVRCYVCDQDAGAVVNVVAAAAGSGKALSMTVPGGAWTIGFGHPGCAPSAVLS